MIILVFLIIGYLISVCISIIAVVVLYRKDYKLKFKDLDTLDMILITYMTLFPLVNSICGILILSTLTSSELKSKNKQKE